MRIVIFCHSIVSDWNHGNAHFLRGVAGDLVARGHQVEVHEPRDGWSRANLVAEHGPGAVTEFEAAFPRIRSRVYDVRTVDVAELTDGADVVIVHEWTEPEIVAAVGRWKAVNGFRLLFHDTHHRTVTAPDQMARFDLRHYDGVLAFGRVVADLYRERGWAERVWTWHEAADTAVFRPLAGVPSDGDLVWIGNWGDEERSVELRRFLMEPVRALGLRARVHGVRYPAGAIAALGEHGLTYAGWLPNHRVPVAFAAHSVTVHVPRRPYASALPGVPTIRPFEAMACGIPLISAPWDDVEGLFVAGRDYLVARDGGEMTRLLDEVLHDRALALALGTSGLATIRSRHTCRHRVDELLGVLAELEAPVPVASPTS